MAAGKYDDERDVVMAVEAGEGVLALCAGSKRERDDDVPSYVSDIVPAGSKRERDEDSAVAVAGESVAVAGEGVAVKRRRRTKEEIRKDRAEKVKAKEAKEKAKKMRAIYALRDAAKKVVALGSAAAPSQGGVFDEHMKLAVRLLKLSPKQSATEKALGDRAAAIARFHATRAELASAPDQPLEDTLAALCEQLRHFDFDFYPKIGAGMHIDRTFYDGPTATVYGLVVSNDGSADWCVLDLIGGSDGSGLKFRHYNLEWSFAMGVEDEDAIPSRAEVVSRCARNGVRTSMTELDYRTTLELLRQE
jgi:hypothetical protein